MSLFNTVRLTARNVVGQFIKGRWVEGTPMDFSIIGSVSPVTPETLQSLLEGQRVTAGIRIITAVSQPHLTAGSVEDEKTGSLVVYDSQYWRVIKKSIWQNGILPSLDYIAIKYKELQQPEQLPLATTEPVEGGAPIVAPASVYDGGGPDTEFDTTYDGGTP